MARTRPPRLIIFDLDGTLVDSETLSNAAFFDVLPALRDHITLDLLLARNRGRKLNDIVRNIVQDFGIALDSEFVSTYRARVAERMQTELRPMPGVVEMLETLNHPVCVASNAPEAKIRLALQVCGLEPYFGDALFSAYTVGAWKPDPALFQAAMASFGVKPAESVIVEDSLVGLQAAHAANARAYYYAPHAAQGPHPREVAHTDAVVFGAMSELPALLSSSAF